MAIDRWIEALEDLHEQLGRCFVRPEPRRRALTYLRGLLGPAVRKNGWQLAEQAGEAEPTGMQRLLREAHWDVEAAGTVLRTYVKQRLGARGGVLVVDETPFRKKGRKSAGVKRQYCGTTGQIENCQVGVFLYYIGAAGEGAFLDRALYLPEDWLTDRPRCRAAGIPETIAFQTKPDLARALLQRAGEAGFRPDWTTGDAVWRCRLWQRSRTAGRAGGLALVLCPWHPQHRPGPAGGGRRLDRAAGGRGGDDSRSDGVAPAQRR